MVLTPYFSPINLAKQLRAALLLRRSTGWRHFAGWLLSNGPHMIPVSAGAVGMGCIGFGYHAVWEVTEACNLRCKHCHVTAGSRGNHELDTSEGKKLLEQLSNMKRFRMLAFSGGEPLVRPDINELLAYGKKLGLVNVIATNGTLIDITRARELKKLGVKGVAVGFDSTDPTTHNAIRQSSTAFRRALNGIEACKSTGMVVQINFTAMRENIRTLPDVIRFCHDIRADIMLCYQLVPMGRGSAIANSALTPDENKALIATIRGLQKSAVTIVEPVAAPQYWSSLLGQDHPGPKPVASGELFHGCAAGWGLIYIKPNGDVWPCPFVPISGGNVRHKELSDIWQHSDIFRQLADRDQLKGSCGSCENRAMCGGCRAKAYSVHGDPLAEDPSCYLHHGSDVLWS